MQAKILGKKIPKNRLKTIYKLIFVLLIIILTAYIWLANNIQRLSGEKIYPNSSEYSFEQNQISRFITVKKSGEVLFHFYFKPSVFAAWIDAQEKELLLVTSDTGLVEGAHGLYIFKDSKINKLHQSNSVKFENGEQSDGKLYNPWINTSEKNSVKENPPENRKAELHRTFFKSPDGRYLFGYERGYEGGLAFAIDLQTMKSVNPNPTAINHHWSSSGKCAIGYTYHYGDRQSIEMITHENSALLVRDLKPVFSESSFGETYWTSDECDGYLEVVTNYDDNGIYLNKPKTSYFRFSNASDTLEPAASLPSNAVLAKPISNSFENIFFTVKEQK